MKKICTICARGGSQGVKNKNIISFLGKPLIAHSILQAKASNLFNTIAVSSDSKKILAIARKWGADCLIKRPDYLASDTAGKLPVIKHAVLEVETKKNVHYDIIVDLDVTSPLRKIDDVKNAMTYFLQHKKANNLITGAKARKSPYFNIVEIDSVGYATLSKLGEKAVVRRQDAPKCYDLNASIYIWKRSALFKNDQVITNNTIFYEMPEERSIDIDTPIDLLFVRMLARKMKTKL
ncbi:MAG: flagellar modification protein B [Gammaproteobacteria bacterium RIFCSPHIGHO2_12_FULL_38_14]|nr:MAG: flagellar modification protein B [Gammaproteobacteria bacterium RIFCSPHIGHO2_12_FULL_38_14]